MAAGDGRLVGHGHHHPEVNVRDSIYRRILWVAMVVNAVMFALELRAGDMAHSLALWGDAVDFGGDAVNYGLSLWLMGQRVRLRARFSQGKAAAMAIFGVALLMLATWRAVHGEVPEHTTMGMVGILALLSNVVVALLLYGYRFGDSNMRSVWLCTRNDAIGNLMVLLAAVGVFWSGSIWPDLVVAAIMALLALDSAWEVLGLANKEIKHGH